MQSNLEDSPPIVKECSMPPQHLKRDLPLMVKKAHSMSPQHLKRDSPLMVNQECSVSPRPLKRSRKKTRDIGEVAADYCGEESIENELNNQLVLYNPGAIGTNRDLISVSDENHPPSFQSLLSSNPYNRVLPSVGAFTVQCANCFKWRLIPTQEKYEEIREHISERPFTCDQAREWRPDISCNDPADITQDGSRLWAIDKPNISQTPPGWERQLRIRGEGSTKFADVYYVAPTGKKLRSMVEIQKYLLEWPEYAGEGVTIHQFSFLTPKPLQENYVRKRLPRLPNPCDAADLGLPTSLEPDEVNPLSWDEPPTNAKLQIARPGLPPPFAPVQCDKHFEPPPAKKKTSKPKIYIRNSGNSVYTQPESNYEDAPRNANSVYMQPENNYEDTPRNASYEV